MLKRIMAVIWMVILACLTGFLLAGCGSDDETREKIQDLEYTVAGEHEIPQELRDLILEKKQEPFKLTYADGQDLYIVVGAGPQKCGGYSMIVEELYLTENSIVCDTELLGPEDKEAAAGGTCYPVLIVKTGYYEKPVVFQ